jgi:hypothetical protein
MFKEEQKSAQQAFCFENTINAANELVMIRKINRSMLNKSYILVPVISMSYKCNGVMVAYVPIHLFSILTVSKPRLFYN